MVTGQSLTVEGVEYDLTRVVTTVWPALDELVEAMDVLLGTSYVSDHPNGIAPALGRAMLIGEQALRNVATVARTYGIEFTGHN